MINRLLLPFCCLLLISQSSQAQITYSKYFGDPTVDHRTEEMKLFQETNFLLGGWITTSYPDLKDSYIMMTDSAGEFIWAKQFDFGTNEFMNGFTTDDEFIYCVVSTGDSEPVNIVKLDEDGNVIWAYNYFSPSMNLRQLEITDDGLIAVGNVNGGPNFEIAIVKLDFDGDVMWSKQYTPDVSPNSDDPWDLTILSNGDILISGITTSYDPPNDGFLMRTDAEGNFLWAKKLSNTYVAYNSFETSTGQLISYVSRGPEGCLMKMNAEGDVQWIKMFAQPLLISTGAVTESHDGNYVATLHCGYPSVATEVPTVVKVDTMGNMQWYRTQNVIGQQQAFNDIFMTSDSGFVMNIPIEIGSNQYQMGIIKTDSLGFSPCSDSLFLVESVDATDITSMDMNFSSTNFSVVKYSVSSGGYVEPMEVMVCCDSLVATIDYTQSGLTYNFTADSSIANDFVWIIGTDTLYGASINYSFDAEGSYEVCQYAENYCNSDSVCQTIEVTHHQNSIGEEELKNITVFPNPFTHQLTILLDEALPDFEVQIYDQRGQMIYVTQGSGKKIELDLEDLSKGLYYLKVEKGGSAFKTKKVVKL